MQPEHQVESSPRTVDELRQALIERRYKLSKRLEQVAAFSMANPDEVAFGTAASIGERAQVQPSTLVRFAQALGYQGFSELQLIFRERLRDRLPSYEERLRALRNELEPAQKLGMLFDGFADAAEHSIRALRNSLRPETLEAAVSILAPAQTIYLIGQRRSFPITAYLNYALGKLRVRNVSLVPPQATIPKRSLSRQRLMLRSRSVLHPTPRPRWSIRSGLRAAARLS